MINKKLNIISKGRKYFACYLGDSSYKAKLLIDERSEKLELGLQELQVEDMSVKTKYGTDFVYKLAGSEKPFQNVCVLKHDRYNAVLVKACQNLAGKYDRDSDAWTFDEIVEIEVEELDWLYNSDIVTIQITSKGVVIGDTDSVYFLGYTIARAKGRDSGAELGKDIVKISGEIRSGGSSKNWATVMNQGSSFRLKISKNLLDTISDNEKGEWEIEVL